MDADRNANEDGKAWIEKCSGACVKALNDLRNILSSSLFYVDIQLLTMMSRSSTRFHLCAKMSSHDNHIHVVEDHFSLSQLELTAFKNPMAVLIKQ